jgi:SAM-dependent methyltransferase
VVTTRDTFGQALLDWVQGGTDVEIVERRDGLTELGAGPAGYCTAFADWPEGQRQAIRLVQGQTADLGCGAGRVALHLQSTGVPVVGIDASRRAVRAATLAGVERARRGDLRSFTGEIGRFETVLLFGNNLGAFGTPARARRALHDWSGAARAGTRLLVESTSPYFGGAPVIDPAYVRENVRLGRTPGQCEMRIWYDRAVSPWIPWFFSSKRELARIVAGTGWTVETWCGTSVREPYVAVLAKR